MFNKRTSHIFVIRIVTCLLEGTSLQVMLSTVAH